MWNLKHSAAHLYRQYELVTCINMFEPWEKKLISKLSHTTQQSQSNSICLYCRWICLNDVCTDDILKLCLSAQLHGDTAAGYHPHHNLHASGWECVCGAENQQHLMRHRQIFFNTPEKWKFVCMCSIYIPQILMQFRWELEFNEYTLWFYFNLNEICKYFNMPR